MQNRQTIYFPENDCSIVTGLCPNGEFGAYLETDDGRVRGYGHSRMAAIADLVEAIGGDDEEEIDHQAIRFDHARALRNEAV